LGKGDCSFWMRHIEVRFIFAIGVPGAAIGICRFLADATNPDPRQKDLRHGRFRRKYDWFVPWHHSSYLDRRVEIHCRTVALSCRWGRRVYRPHRPCLACPPMLYSMDTGTLCYCRWICLYFTVPVTFANHQVFSFITGGFADDDSTKCCPLDCGTLTRTGAILPQCRSCHSGKFSATKLNHFKPSDLYQLARAEIDFHLQKSIATSLTKVYTRGGASVKSHTCLFVDHALTALQHQFLSKVLGTRVLYGRLCK